MSRIAVPAQVPVPPRGAGMRSALSALAISGEAMPLGVEAEDAPHHGGLLRVDDTMDAAVALALIHVAEDAPPGHRAGFSAPAEGIVTEYRRLYKDAKEARYEGGEYTPADTAGIDGRYQKVRGTMRKALGLSA